MVFQGVYSVVVLLATVIAHSFLDVAEELDSLLSLFASLVHLLQN